MRSCEGKPGLSWRPRDAAEALAGRGMSAGEGCRRGGGPLFEVCCEGRTIRTLWHGTQGYRLDCYFLMYSLPFGMVMYILCTVYWKYVICFSDFFTVSYNEETALSLSENTWNFKTVLSVKDYGNV